MHSWYACAHNPVHIGVVSARIGMSQWEGVRIGVCRSSYWVGGGSYWDGFFFCIGMGDQQHTCMM